jgi:hypothetical protein
MAYAIPTESLDRLDQYAAEGRIIRGEWTSTDAHGRETTCLLAALDPERIDAPGACPAEWLPTWLAHLTPRMDDETSDEAWPVVVTRYRRVLRHIHILTPEGSERAMWITIDAALAIAQPHDAAGVVARVRALIARQVAGDRPSAGEWAAARAAEAAGAARVAGAAEAAAWAAGAAAWAAEAARVAGAARVAWAAEAAAWAAARAAEAAAEALAASLAAALAAAWDRITDTCLTALEAEMGLPHD